MKRNRNGAEAQTDQHVYHALSQEKTAHGNGMSDAVKLAQTISKQIRMIAWAGMQLNSQMESDNTYKVPTEITQRPIYT